jgi:hypothetical protein
MGALIALTTPIWARYHLPVLCLAATTTGAGLAELQRRLGGWRSQALIALVAAGLLGTFVGLNLTGLTPHEGRRVRGAGMISPARTPHDGFSRAVRALARYGDEIVLVYDSVLAQVRTEDALEVWRTHGVDHVELRHQDAEAWIRGGKPVPVVLIRAHPARQLRSTRDPELWPAPPPGDDPEMYQRHDRVTWLLSQARRRRLLSVTDPDGMQFKAYVVAER